MLTGSGHYTILLKLKIGGTIESGFCRRNAYQLATKQLIEQLHVGGLYAPCEREDAFNFLCRFRPSRASTDPIKEPYVGLLMPLPLHYSTADIRIRCTWSSPSPPITGSPIMLIKGSLCGSGLCMQGRSTTTTTTTLSFGRHASLFLVY